MYPRLPAIFHSKTPAKLLITFFTAIFLMLESPTLEAGGWGKTGDVFEYESTTWNGVYFDMNGLSFLASIPNYSGASLQNGLASLTGSINQDIGYIIEASFIQTFTPPKTLQGFVKMVQDANPAYIINIVDASPIGAKYAVDLIPIDQNAIAFWRFISTDRRLIKMGTDDTDINRRLYFFESLYIQ